MYAKSRRIQRPQLSPTHRRDLILLNPSLTKSVFASESSASDQTTRPLLVAQKGSFALVASNYTLAGYDFRHLVAVAVAWPPVGTLARAAFRRESPGNKAQCQNSADMQQSSQSA